jgi:hypothetical protein
MTGRPIPSEPWSVLHVWSMNATFTRRCHCESPAMNRLPHPACSVSLL